MPMNGYLHSLAQLVHRHIATLESMFGERDKKFVFGDIVKAPADHDNPHTHFPNGFHLNGGCVVDIRISRCPYEHSSPDQGAWQVAHECVHLLDPTEKVGSTFLEEGLATWYQNEARFHDDLVQRYIERKGKLSSDYVKAERLVRECTPEKLISAVREIRAQGIRISEIQPAKLSQHLSNADEIALERLCESFP